MLWGSKNINLTFTELYKCTWISRHWKWILNSIAKLEGYFGHIFCVCVLHTSAQCTTNSNKLQTYGNILYFSYLILQFVNVFSPSFFTKRMLFTLTLSKIGAKEKKKHCTVRGGTGFLHQIIWTILYECNTRGMGRLVEWFVSSMTCLSFV